MMFVVVAERVNPWHLVPEEEGQGEPVHGVQDDAWEQFQKGEMMKKYKSCIGVFFSFCMSWALKLPFWYKIPLVVYICVLYVCEKNPKSQFCWQVKAWDRVDIVHWTRTKGETETEGQSWLQVKGKTAEGLLWCGGSPASTLSLFNI